MDKESQNLSEDIELDDYDVNHADKGGFTKDTNSNTQPDFVQTKNRAVVTPMEDVQLSFRSSEQSKDQKFGRHLKNKDENSSSFMEETSRSLAYRLSNIFGAPDDVYIPGLDDDPKPKLQPGRQSNVNHQHQSVTAMTQRNKQGSLSINLSMSDNNNQANTFRERSNKYKTEAKQGGQKNIYRDSDASKTEDSEHFDTEGTANGVPAIGEEGEPVATVGNASVAQTYFNMLKCFIGIGILATPAAIQTVGIVGGAIGIMFCGILNMYTMKMQIACKEKVGAHITSYSELGFAVLGAHGQAFIDLCITISQFGFCIAYLIFIGNQLDQVICIETQQDYCNYKNTYIMVSAFLLVPICWLKGLKYISYVSMFANASIIFALIVIMSYNEKSYVNEPDLHKDIRYMDASHMPMFFGIAVFNFEGNGVVCNLHNSMKDPSKFDSIMRNVMIFVISLLCIFSISSYEAYGYRIDDMVTMNLPHDNLTSSVQLLYCLGLLGSYPIQVIPAIDITEKSKCFNRLPSIFGDKLRWVNSIVLRSLIVIFTGFSAMVIPKFGLFINLTGAFACTALAFVVPVIMYQVLFKDQLTPFWRNFNYAVVIFGTMAGSVSFILSFIEIMKAFTEKDEEVFDDIVA